MDRKEYIDKLSSKLKTWDNEIAKLEAKAGEAKEQARLDYQSQLEKLRIRRQEAVNRVEEIREASEGAWQELKSGAEESFENMKKAMDNALSMFK